MKEVEKANKLYYSISEISKIIDEKQHTLIYWEKNLPFLKPRKSKSGKRRYTKKHLELFKTVKENIREKQLTLAGTKVVMENPELATEETNEETVVLSKEEFNELVEILQLMIMYMKSKK
ncbi:MAG: MerR family transcriptional regulator [Ignavibacteria bacterium]|jgi:DNA-binding transcriptional MerR regulator|nr:MerR family transcriptional regulator [Ignavibacteria bacterium]